MDLVTLVDERMLKAGQEEGAKAPPAAIRQADVVPFQQTRKEVLDQVLGVGRRMPLSANVGVERILVGAAKPVQGLLGLGRFCPPGGQHHAPMGRGKRAVGLLPFPDSSFLSHEYSPFCVPSNARLPAKGSQSEAAANPRLPLRT